MAYKGKNRHYEWGKIGPRHIRETARFCGMEGSIDTMLNRLTAKLPKVVTELSASLPSGFPDTIASPIFMGLEKQCRLLADL